MKKFLIFIAALAVSLCLSAQTVLPNDPEVRSGKLDNGLTYFIRHNDIPAQKCEFYLVTDAGAINQGEGQDGLAHFLEHMCFNGLRSLPGKQMLEYLQSIGAAFGANINAGTGIDRTSYMLNDIPIVREGILDTCLLVMHDYSHFVLNEPEEIDSERGVILEEKRTRNTAGWRLFEKSAPYIYGDTKYATAPADLIGSEQTLRTFKPETLVDFYHTWYRPDKQAVIVVGDIDVDAVEAKLKALFADIPAAENPRQLEPIIIPDNDQPLIGVITDPETSDNCCEFYWRRPSIPVQYRNTDQALAVSLIGRLVSCVMDERFTDITSSPDAPFQSADLSSVGLIESCDAIAGEVNFKNGDDRKAIQAFLYQVEKLRRYGVTDAELQRAKDNMISGLEHKLQGASTRKNPEFIGPIMRYFLNNWPFLAPETELELVRGVFSQVDARLVNQLISQYITDKNMSVVLSGPSQVEHPSDAEILAMIQSVASSEIEAPAVEAALTSLVEPGSIKAGKVRKSEITLYGATQWMLSNGLKVVVLPTEYKKGEVLFDLSLPGGKSLIEDDDLYSFEDNMLSVLNEFSGVGDFGRSDLMKALSGKIADMSPYLEDDTHGISGSSSPKDVETALQLLYLEFARPRFDPDEFETALNRLRAVLPNMESTPSFQFYKHLMTSLHEDGPRNFFISQELLSKISLEAYGRVYSGSLYKDVAGAVLYIVGDVDLQALKPLVELYAGALPKGKRPSSFIDRGMRYRAGRFEDRFDTAMEAPKVSVFQYYNSEFEPTVQNRLTLDALEYILRMVYTDTLREEEGGTYGASVVAGYERVPVGACRLYVVFDTNTAQASSLEKMAVKGLEDLAHNGPSDEYFARTVEYYKAQLPQMRISNSYWLECLKGYFRFAENADALTEAAMNEVSKEDISALARRLLESGNFTTVVMSPEQK